MARVLTTVEAVRARFSALQQPIAFFDGPGGTQVPDSVIEAVADYYRSANANTGGAFETSRRTDALITTARVAAAEFLNATVDEVAFGANMTTLNFALTRAAARDWEAGDEIVCTRARPRRQRLAMARARTRPRARRAASPRSTSSAGSTSTICARC